MVTHRFEKHENRSFPFKSCENNIWWEGNRGEMKGKGEENGTI